MIDKTRLSDLKRCPFCGALNAEVLMRSQGHYWEVVCRGRDIESECGARVTGDTEEFAIGAWNTRTLEAALTLERDTLALERERWKKVADEGAEIVPQLRAENAALREREKRLSAPITPEEWQPAHLSVKFHESGRHRANAIIASRLASPEAETFSTDPKDVLANLARQAVADGIYDKIPEEYTDTRQYQSEPPKEPQS